MLTSSSLRAASGEAMLRLIKQQMQEFRRCRLLLSLQLFFIAGFTSQLLARSLRPGKASRNQNTPALAIINIIKEISSVKH